VPFQLVPLHLFPRSSLVLAWTKVGPRGTGPPMFCTKTVAAFQSTGRRDPPSVGWLGQCVRLHMDGHASQREPARLGRAAYATIRAIASAPSRVPALVTWPTASSSAATSRSVRLCPLTG
jgi:hypothetical protein